MNRNLATLDRYLRILVGVVLLSLMFIGPRTIFGLIGLVPLLTAVAGHCPIYSLLGISTHWKGDRNHRSRTV